MSTRECDICQIIKNSESIFPFKTKFHTRVPANPRNSGRLSKKRSMRRKLFLTKSRAGSAKRRSAAKKFAAERIPFPQSKPTRFLTFRKTGAKKARDTHAARRQNKTEQHPTWSFRNFPDLRIPRPPAPLRLRNLLPRRRASYSSSGRICRSS